MMVEISTCFVWSMGWGPSQADAQTVRRRAPMVITDRQGADVDLELWHNDVMCGGLLISARSQNRNQLDVARVPPKLTRTPTPGPIVIDIAHVTQLRLGLLCAIGDDDAHDEIDSAGSIAISPKPVLRFMIGPVASQHTFSVGCATEPHVEIDVLSCCVGDGGIRRRDVCAQLSLEAACANVYDFGARPTVVSPTAGSNAEIAQLYRQ